MSVTPEDLAVKLQEVADRSKRNEGRIKKLEENQQALNELALSVRELATEQGNMKDDLVEIKADVKGMAAKPGKKWDGLVDKAIWLLAGTALAALLAQAGIVV